MIAENLMSDTHGMSRIENGATLAEGEGMPRGVRRALWSVLLAVMLVASYLLAVRGPAILVDLATGVANAFCF